MPLKILPPQAYSQFVLLILSRIVSILIIINKLLLP